MDEVQLKGFSNSRFGLNVNTAVTREPKTPIRQQTEHAETVEQRSQNQQQTSREQE